MGTVTIELWAPVHPLLFLAFLAVTVVYLLYSAYKFVASIVTGG